MPKFLADEGFNRDIVHGVRERMPDIDLILVQDVGLEAASDPIVLEWAARDGRVVLTTDKRTMRAYADERLRYGLPLPGVVVIHQDAPVGYSIRNLLRTIQTSHENEWENQIRFIRRR